MEDTRYNDEIDIKELLKNVIKVLERGTKIILIAVVIGAIVGIIYSFKIGKTFESSMVLRSDILVLENVEALFDPLILLMDEDNTATLGERLLLDDGKASL